MHKILYHIVLPGKNALFAQPARLGGLHLEISSHRSGRNHARCNDATRYGEYEDLRKLVRQSLQRTDRILVVGCGNSNFSPALYDDGFEEV